MVLCRECPCLACEHLADSLHGLAEVLRIGDCLAPRTAEEAIYEGLKAAWSI